MAEAPRKTPPRMMEVVHTATVGKNLQNVVFSGADLRGLPTNRHGAHIKLFFPRHDQEEPVLPTLDPSGTIQWPPPDQRPIVRTYSFRGFDPSRNELQVEFVRHAHPGPASRWAMRAKPGDRIGLAGPGGPFPMLPRSRFYGFCVDLSSLPAVSALLETLPSDACGEMLCEVPDALDVRDLPRPRGIELRWLLRPEGQSSSLIAEARRIAWSSPETFAFVAGENTAVVSIRDYLRREFGFDRRSMYAIPYWKESHNEEDYHQERHRIMDELEEVP